MADAANEAEVRDRFCREFDSHFNIPFKFERERNDARLNRTILEFKDKGLFKGNASSAKFKEAYNQLVGKYIPNLAAAEKLPLHSYIGVAIDGEHYAFVFFEENGTHRHTALVPITADSLHPLLDTLQSDVRRAFTIENLLEDFGANSEIAHAVIHELWGHLRMSLQDQAGSQKVKMLFQEWKRLFAQATSLGRIGRAQIDRYLLAMGLTKPIDLTEALFTLHTYNALLFKLLAGELVTTIRYKQNSGFASHAAGLPSSVLLDSLNHSIEHAEVFIANNIENFIEGTFFSWYIEGAQASLLEAIRKLLARLGLYRFPTSRHDQVKDVVKAFYQGLVPDALRKNIGEFYTPEWLVDFVLNQTGYKGGGILDKKLLDPCCGSGNFLIHAIARYKEEARKKGEANEAIGSQITQHIFGFDLNPLAVIAARLNYLLAIADVLPRAGRVEIPVYMADAVYAPVRNDLGDISTRSYKIGTVLGNIELELPEELVQRHRQFGETLSIMERAIEADDSRDDFIALLRQNAGLSVLLDRHSTWANYLGEMFDRVQEMERKNWNRIWCRIVRNYFASVAIGQVQVIASNPPWVRWSELPEDYRERIKPTCDQYSIFSRTPFFGGNELDISGMIAYTVTDKWLENGGVLGLVITQVHFQAASSEGFRSFKLPDGTPLGITEVHDFSHVKPFPKLSNKPAVYTWTRGLETLYPVRYMVWNKRESASIPEDASLIEATHLMYATEMEAVAIPPDQRWSILPAHQRAAVAKLQGGSNAWTGRKGITTDLNAAYFVELLGEGITEGLVRIRTTPDSGKKPVPLIDREVDAALVYPLLKGAGQIGAFSYKPIGLVAIVPNQTITSISPEANFRREYAATFRYFQRINRVKDDEGRPLLENRSTWRTRMQMMESPFYAIYNVGSYTFARNKVVWAEMSGEIAAAVVSTDDLPYGIGRKSIIPDHKVYFVATNSKAEAHFLCALLNSELVRAFVNSFTVKIQVGALFSHLKLPPYDAKNPHHRSLAGLSRKAHRFGVNDEIRLEINRIAESVINAMGQDEK